ncbi:hypothetical protein L226DRAFT_383667 [Lentinus tigrinus ALCF2SS1-7]|uniref:Uncharacterized protein n=1 Tax=Lentinus tigrinus ALCF2SS1-6 TaxID=1328759 RepID=A0A5C2SMI4_9APHY|nr:hypothetical protein L227DRAFT_572030 [Lentinus tigrinus ALCF2SS1-6]RPD76695.1 hypothetical protein L226DRAFT_383667 [Lentinus tigrinus ALCF2SS1-7]
MQVLRSEHLQCWLPSVRTLWWSTRDPGATWFNETESEKRPIIQELAGRLPNLSLLLLEINWSDHPPHPSTFRTFARFKALTTLRLIRCRFPSFAAFRYTITSLPSLDSLAVQFVLWPYKPQIQLGAPSTLALRELSVHCGLDVSWHDIRMQEDCAAGFMQWARDSIRDVAYFPIHYREFSSRGHDALLSPFGPSIQDLAIHVYTVENYDHQQKQFGSIGTIQCYME